MRSQITRYRILTLSIELSNPLTDIFTTKYSQGHQEDRQNNKEGERDD